MDGSPKCYDIQLSYSAFSITLTKKKLSTVSRIFETCFWNKLSKKFVTQKANKLSETICIFSIDECCVFKKWPPEMGPHLQFNIFHHLRISSWFAITDLCSGECPKWSLAKYHNVNYWWIKDYSNIILLTKGKRWRRWSE